MHNKKRGPHSRRVRLLGGTVLLFLLLAFLPPLPTHAADGITSDGLVYTISDNQISITGYSGVANVVRIPSIINGLMVTSIGNSAFYTCDNITTIVIPDSVTNIGDFAFALTGLTDVVIPNSVTSIGLEAFCKCTNLTSVVLPKGLTSIADGTFSDCSSLGSITIPSTVVSIGNSAFRHCSLTGITIPNSVIRIGDDAFIYCSLISVDIPSSVASIGELAFDCGSLAFFTVDAANPFYSSISGVLFNKSQTTLLKYPAAMEGAYTIPSSVTTIGDTAFYDCPHLTNVTIPNSVVRIGISGFFECRSLIRIILPNSITSIGEGAFAECSALASVSIPKSLTSIGDEAFYGCYSLTWITVDPRNPAYKCVDGVLFNSNMTTLVLYPAAKLGGYVIPNTVTTIADAAFDACGMLTSVKIPNRVTSIGKDAFSFCTSLTAVVIPENVVSIGDGAFLGSLSAILFTGNAPTLGAFVFAENPANMTVYYYKNSKGFRSPVWNGLRAVAVAPFAVATREATGPNYTTITLNGAVTPNGFATTAYFQYGDSTAYGNATPKLKVGRTKSVPFSATISNLKPTTNYHYRSVAVNSSGIIYGADKTFVTAPPPTANTEFAIPTSYTTSVLVATANPNGLATRVYFQYGRTAAYDLATAEQNIGSGASKATFSAEVSNLLPSTTYHYRCVATNSSGTVYGADRSFTTPNPDLWGGQD